MKIGFDVSDLVTDRADGTTRYTRELAKRLPALGAEHEWLYFAPGDIGNYYKLQANSYKLIKSPWPKYWTQSRLPFDLYRYRPDVLFMPIQQIPYVRPGRMRTVAVVHDLAFHIYPEQFTYKDWVLQHVFTSYVSREADHIIAVSQATADDIASYYGRTEDVHVVHHGLDHEQFRLPTDDERERSWEKLHRAYPQVQRPYLLFVGQIQPRKNLVRLIEAFEQLAARDTDLQLVIAGGHGWLNAPIYERVKRSQVSERIFLLGRVPDELLPFLYWHADVFVLPSLYEGFGMPIVEAMACGCPVVTSNMSSMPEVAGSAAVLVDPESDVDMAQGIKEARARYHDLQQRGLAQACMFTWEATAQQTAQILFTAQHES